MKNPDEAKNLIRSIYQSNADLVVDKQNKRLCVCLHHSNFAAVDKIIHELFNILNETQTVFPGSDLKLFYILVSNKIPPIKEICIYYFLSVKFCIEIFQRVLTVIGF